jgi:hypothetical protein
MESSTTLELTLRNVNDYQAILFINPTAVGSVTANEGACS